jgi:hypothetical protein
VERVGEEIGLGGMAWIGLPEERDKWKVLVNMIVNLQVP